MRFAARVDGNQAAIVGGLRACGASVQSLAPIGAGCADLLVGHRGRNWLMELKDPSKPPSARKLTPAQVEWHRTWCGQVAVVETVEQALGAIGVGR